jgi:prefoldin beta subunit
MVDVPEEMQEKIKQLQMLEQALQQLLMQKQQFQLQLMEVDSAIKELEGKEEAYKIVGSIMISSKKEDLDKELKEKKETLELRISSIDKQETETREKASTMQKEVISAMNPGQEQGQEK